MDVSPAYALYPYVAEFTKWRSTHAARSTPLGARRTPSTLDRHSDGRCARPAKRCRIIQALDERIPFRLDSAHAAALELVHDVVSDYEDASACCRLVWHALAIYRRALIDLEVAETARGLDVVFLAASLLLAQRMMMRNSRGLARLEVLTNAFMCASGEALAEESIADCTWRIAVSRGYDFACVRSCPFDVAADVLLAHVAGSGDAAECCALPIHVLLEDRVADRLREAGDHLLAIASSSSRGIASEASDVLGAAAAMCAVRARDGSLTPIALHDILARLKLHEQRDAVLAAAVQMRAELLVVAMLHKLPADVRKRICVARWSGGRASLSELTAMFVAV